MRLNQESEYALRALLFLAQQPDGTVMTARELARRLDIPEAFFFKIVRKLVRHGILTPHRSGQRGYSLARSPQKISIMEILIAIEGPDIFERCIFWNQRCGDENPCFFHRYWSQYREPFFENLKSLNLANFHSFEAFS